MGRNTPETFEGPRDDISYIQRATNASVYTLGVMGELGEFAGASVHTAAGGVWKTARALFTGKRKK